MVSLNRGIRITSSCLDRSRVGPPDAAGAGEVVAVDEVGGLEEVAGAGAEDVDAAEAAGAADAEGLFTRFEISSPGAPMIARRSLTWILPPLSVPVYNKVPSL